MNKEVFFRECGFVMNAQYSGAITFRELQEWGYLKIKEDDSSFPTFIYEIPSASDVAEVHSLIGSVNLDKFKYDLNDSEDRALYGIAYKRGFYSKENPCELCTEKTALKNLEKNPHILERFKQTFPFIKLDCVI